MALAVGVLAPVAFALYSTLLSPGAGLGGLETGFWAAVALALGAANACLVARVATRLALRASHHSLPAASHSVDRALVVSMRAGGAVGLFVETVSFIAISLVFGLLFAMKGGFRLAPAEAIALGRAVALLLPAHALGAATAALVLQRGGATYHTSGDLAADLAGERDAGLDHDDARNPAVIADLVGDHVGKAAGRATDLYVTATTSTVVALLIGASVLDANRAQATLALAAFPLVARAFGVVATGFGVMIARTDDSDSPASALWRGQLTTAVVSLAGLLGAAHWLVAESGSIRLFWAGAFGLLAASMAAHAARLQIDRRIGPLRELIETQRVGESTGLAFGMSSGLGATAWPLGALAVAITAAWAVGASSGLPLGGVLGALTALMTILGIRSLSSRARHLRGRGGQRPRRVGSGDSSRRRAATYSAARRDGTVRVHRVPSLPDRHRRADGGAGRQRAADALHEGPSERRPALPRRGDERGIGAGDGAGLRRQRGSRRDPRRPRRGAGGRAPAAGIPSRTGPSPDPAGLHTELSQLRRAHCAGSAAPDDGPGGRRARGASGPRRRASPDSFATTTPRCQPKRWPPSWWSPLSPAWRPRWHCTRPRARSRPPVASYAAAVLPGISMRPSPVTPSPTCSATPPVRRPIS